MEGPVQFFDLFAAAARYRRCAHIGVDFCSARAADYHGIELAGQVHLVGREHHAAGGNFITNLICGEVGFALGDPFHLRRRHTQTSMFQLCDGHKTVGGLPLAVFQSPVGGHEVPGCFE